MSELLSLFNKIRRLEIITPQGQAGLLRGLGSNGTANRLSEKFHSAFLSFTARLMVLRLQPTVF
jgi:hypothetical protein